MPMAHGGTIMVRSAVSVGGCGGSECPAVTCQGVRVSLLMSAASGKDLLSGIGRDGRVEDVSL